MKVVDMHCDTLLSLLDNNESIYENNCSVDLCKMLKGDYLLQTFACFVDYQHDEPLDRCMRLIDKYYEQIDRHQDIIGHVNNYQDILDNIKIGRMSSLLSIEEGQVINNDLAILRNYYRLGVRMITLCWNYPNGIGYPNMDISDTSFNGLKRVDDQNGLTSFGIEYIKEMEKLGMIIDVSHLSDKGFYDVYDHTSKPFVASHSNARSVCSVARNLTDDMILKIAKRKGVIGINFCGDFLRDSENGGMASMIDDMVKHIKYIDDIAGIDCIGLGTDFDGISSELEIKDASYMSLLANRLKEEGFDDEKIAKIFYKNVLRVLENVLK